MFGCLCACACFSAFAAEDLYTTNENTNSNILFLLLKFSTGLLMHGIFCKVLTSKTMTQHFCLHVYVYACEKESYLMFNFPKLCCSFYESPPPPFLYLPRICPLVLPLSHSLYCLRRRGDI